MQTIAESHINSLLGQIAMLPTPYCDTGSSNSMVFLTYGLVGWLVRLNVASARARRHGQSQEQFGLWKHHSPNDWRTNHPHVGDLQLLGILVLVFWLMLQFSGTVIKRW